MSRPITMTEIIEELIRAEAVQPPAPIDPAAAVIAPGRAGAPSLIDYVETVAARDAASGVNAAEGAPA